MSNINTISVDEAEEIMDDGPIAVQAVSEHRWYTKQLVVVERDGELLGFYYLKPASELQEGQERFESDPVKVFPVTARAITSTVYEVSA